MASSSNVSERGGSQPLSAPALPSSDLLIALLMPPLLLSLVGGRALAQLMQQAGQATEGLYRGSRLPSLTMPPDLPE